MYELAVFCTTKRIASISYIKHETLILRLQENFNII